MEILWTLYRALPAFVANMAPVFAAHWQLAAWLNYPIDGGRTWRGARLFGDHKTLRGFVAGTVAGGVTALAQHVLFSAPLPYHTVSSALAFGALGGLGALGGDALESAVKRRLGITPGKPFMPFDAIDYALGFLVITWPLYSWGVFESMVVIIFAALANPLANLAGYRTGLRPAPW